jgi:predicted ATPase/DNA-binding winged helix-turn-helix (wHTH) protein
MLTRGNRPVYALGQCEVDFDRRELRVLGAPAPIGGRAFDILELLVRSAGALVRKEELMGRVWPGATVSDNALQVHISALRKALGAQRTMLKTESGRGYRLLGEWTLRDQAATGQPVFEAPPIAKRGAQATNLPGFITPLIGRSIAAGLLRNLVSAYRLVTLTGPGGIGKTTLALQLARELLPEFGDGAWLVELAPLSSPDLVPSAVAGVLGLNLGGETTAAAVARVIHEKNLLLVLDNCEHVIDGAANLAETLLRFCPRVTVLATSREVLRASGEYVYRVSPLDVPGPDDEPDDILGRSAVELFVARSRASGSEFSAHAENLSSIAAICRHLDGIPLAIEFAAARVAVLGVEQVAAALGERFTLLTSGRRTAVPRHRTLRAALDWSYELLPENERIVLRRLAVFAGSFTLQAASAVAAADDIAPSEVADCFAKLVEKSLATAGAPGVGTRFRLLETTRAYALEMLAEAGEFDTAARRHATRYLDLFESAEAEAELQTRPTNEWLEEFRTRIDNLRTALDWAFLPGGDTAIGVALTAAAVPLWMELSLMEECRSRVEQALTALAPDSDRDPRSRMKLFAALAASLMYTRGAISEVRVAGEKALEVAESLGDAEYQLRSLFGLHSFHINSGHQGVALTLAERFLAVAADRSQPDDRPVGERLIGTSRHYLGDLVSARQHLERVLDRHDARARTWQIARFEVDQRAAAQVYLARVLWLQGLPDQAMRTAEGSVADARAANHAISLGLALARAACPIALFNGDLDMAGYYVEMLLDHSTRHALARWFTFARSYQAILVIRRGDLDTGLQMLRAAFDDPAAARPAAFDDPAAARPVAFVTCVMAEALGNAAQVGHGLALIEEAIARAEETEERWVMAELLRIKGELVLLRGVPGASPAAEGLFRQALDWARRQGALSWELRSAISLARLWCTRPRHDAARELLTSVYDRFVEGFGTADLKAARTLLEGLS